MIESESFFEAYRYFLKVLKEVRTEAFPLKKYIVSISTDVQPPKYAANRSQMYFKEMCCNSRSGINENKTFEHFSNCWCRKIRIHSELDWSQLNMDLDYSQERAVKSALTKSLCIIQGPPGTGKTHVGICIVRLLLFNRHVWSPTCNQCPILVVCATNHALDQFLERIMKVTDKIVRIGGQSKCEALRNYNLSVLRQSVNWRDLGNSLGAKREAERQRNRITKEMREIMETRSVGKNKMILLDDLKNDISDDHLESFDGETVDDNLLFCYWLAGGSRKSNSHIRDWRSQGGMEYVRKTSSKKLQCQPLSQKSRNFYRDIWALNNEDRWRLYRYWLNRHMERNDILIEMCKEKLEKEIQIIEKVNRERDCVAIRDAHVVGLTTTGAAKFNYLIKGVKPKIVIVEEAAEVLEAHIVTSLCEDTQHLILIGDHQQLRPSPTVYELGKKFNMEISLFERLVKNGVPFCRLDIQHRMKPCISRLLVPHIYKELKDHSNVSEYKDIKGIENSMFFLTHNILECKDQDSTSHVNEHEIDFLVELARYLLLQGYMPSQITILATYKAQLNNLKNKMGEYLKDVTATCVDNFQGEESDIVLISFVRSNEEGTIGFLKTENRVCVALSRAKLGLYCIGNFQLFARRSELWRNIVKDLKTQKAFGSALNIKCQYHGHIVPVKRAREFLPLSDGGCGQPCKHNFPCGHVCPRKCHSDYEEYHAKYKCREECCRIICKQKHKCPKLCWEPCEKCIVAITKVFPKCSHAVLILCYLNSDLLQCKLPCERYLSCGHKCKENCGSPCGKCNEPVRKPLSKCKHLATMPCYQDPELHVCKLPCDRRRPCGHRCSKTCAASCGSCTVLVKKLIPKCQHEATIPCSMDPNLYECKMHIKCAIL